MCMRQNRDPRIESDEESIEDPIRHMREPPGALGDIVRRMKRRAVLERGAWASAGANDVGCNTA